MICMDMIFKNRKQSLKTDIPPAKASQGQLYAWICTNRCRIREQTSKIKKKSRIPTKLLKLRKQSHRRRKERLMIVIHWMDGLNMVIVKGSISDRNF